MRGDARHDLSSSLSHPTTSSELCFSQDLRKISSLIDSLGQELYVHLTKHLHPRPLLRFGRACFWFDRIDLIVMRIRGTDDNCAERLLTRTRIRLVT